MPDAKRKLPVLCIPKELASDITTGTRWRLKSWEVEPCRVSDVERLNLVELKSAVPRCRTCKNYVSKPDGRRCELPDGLWVPGASENGFCHNHSDLK